MITDTFHKAQKYNGMDVQLRMAMPNAKSLTLEGTFIRAEVVGAKGADQLKITLQFSNFEVSDYRDLQKLVGNQVAFQLGAIKDTLMLDSLSTLHTDKRFNEERDLPVTLVFSDIEVEAMKEGSLIKDLRAAGFLSIAEKIEQILIITSKPGHEKLAKAVDLLKARHRYALAEQVDQIRVEIYGEVSPGEDKRKLITGLVKNMLTQIESNADNDTLVQEITAFILDKINPEDEGEKEAVGPGSVPYATKAPQTVVQQPMKPPTPQRGVD